MLTASGLHSLNDFMDLESKTCYWQLDFMADLGLRRDIKELLLHEMHEPQPQESRLALDPGSSRGSLWSPGGLLSA